MELSSLSCTDFSAVLASKSAVSGGGGVAALMGALASALCSMAGNLTMGKPKFTEISSEIEQIVTSADKLRLEFLDLIERDAAAFEPLSQAYSLPKNDPNYANTMKKVSMDASKTPCEIIKYSCITIDLLESMFSKCSKLIISDVGCGAIVAKATLEAAAMNVFVNTKMFRGDPEADQMESYVNDMLHKYTKKAQNISDSVMKILRGG